MARPETATEPDMIRILLVDDHTLFRRGLTALLSRDAHLQVVGDAADAVEAFKKAVELQPDVILLDNHLPGVRGIDAIAQLRQSCPSACVLMLTVSEDAQDMAAALRAGACGYLLKTIEGDALTLAIRRALDGENVIAPEMTAKLVEVFKQSARPAGATYEPPAPSSPIEALSPRERDILRGIAKGESNKEIARALGIAETTVKIHVQHLLRKLGVSSRVHAAVIATHHDLH